MLICVECGEKKKDGSNRFKHYHICDKCRIKLEIGEVRENDKNTKTTKGTRE